MNTEAEAVNHFGLTASVFSCLERPSYLAAQNPLTRLVNMNKNEPVDTRQIDGFYSNYSQKALFGKENSLQNRFTYAMLFLKMF